METDLIALRTQSFIRPILQLRHTTVNKLFSLSLCYLQNPSALGGQTKFYSSQNKRRSLMLFLSSPARPASVKSHSHASSYFSMHQLRFELVPTRASQSISRFSIYSSHWLQVLIMLKLGLMPRYRKTSWVHIGQRSGQKLKAGPYGLTRH